jgi:hypothetical protein
MIGMNPLTEGAVPSLLTLGGIACVLAPEPDVTPHPGHADWLFHQ